MSYTPAVWYEPTLTPPDWPCQSCGRPMPDGTLLDCEWCQKALDDAEEQALDRAAGKPRIFAGRDVIDVVIEQIKLGKHDDELAVVYSEAEQAENRRLYGAEMLEALRNGIRLGKATVKENAHLIARSNRSTPKSEALKDVVEALYVPYHSTPVFLPTNPYPEPTTYVDAFADPVAQEAIGRMAERLADEADQRVIDSCAIAQLREEMESIMDGALEVIRRSWSC